MTTFTTRKAKLADLKELLSFALKTFKATYEHQNEPHFFAEYLEKAFDEATFLEDLQNPMSHFFIIENEGKIIAYTKLNEPTVQSDLQKENTLEIERIYVSEAEKGQGLGRVLIQQAIKMAQDLNLKTIWLGVWENNPAAIAFYQRMGFKQTGTHLFMMGTDPQKDFIMELEVD